MSELMYFLDTYALFEIVRGNEKYAPYAKSHGVTTIFNIAEFNYNLKKEISQKEANLLTDRFRSKTVKVLWQDVKDAMDLKIKHKKMSIPDVIGYMVARRLGIPFLTGDGDFEDLENVELVKK